MLIPQNLIFFALNDTVVFLLGNLIEYNYVHLSKQF